MQNILIIGTVDTKSDEIDYMRKCILNLNCNAIIMDVSVLGDPSIKVDYSKHDIAKHAGMSNQDIINLGNENDAMIASAKGARKLSSNHCMGLNSIASASSSENPNKFFAAHCISGVTRVP